MAIEETVSNHESRIVKLEDSFRSAAESLKMLVEMARHADERADAGDEARIHTDARLIRLVEGNGAKK